MFDSKQVPPACVYLLGDHLDAALAAGEDLAATSLQITVPLPSGGIAELDRRQAELAGFLNRLRTLEAALVARVLQARRRAEELPRSDAHLKLLVGLFLSGTAVLLDAVEEFGDPSGLAFNSGADGFHFLRDRGLIAADAASLPMAGRLMADEEYLVAGRVRLGPLMDLIATFLDALDARFNLYDEDVEVILERAGPTPAPILAAEAGHARDALTAAASRPQLVAEALEALYGSR